jgi:hypothetical protein
MKQTYLLILLKSSKKGPRGPQHKTHSNEWVFISSSPISVVLQLVPNLRIL